MAPPSRLRSACRLRIGARAIGLSGVLGLTLMLGVSGADAQQIRGFVVEASTGDPIASAQVWLQTPDGVDLTLALTGPDGRFTLVPESAGTYRIEARRQGYATTAQDSVEWNGEAAQTVVLRMPLRPVELEGIEVEAQSDVRLEHQATYAGLYRRAEDARPVGRDRVYLRDELEFDDFRTVAEYVANRQVPGMTRSGVVMEGGRAPPAGIRLACSPQIIWVGFDAPVDVSDRRFRHTYLQMQVRELEAIELYGDAGEAPLGLRPSPPGCGGLIVLWPRRVAGEGEDQGERR